MKKSRYFPFGYSMDEGKIVILPQESELLQKLFSHYLNGASLQQLADLAAQSGLRFREDSEHWNKNRIARILDDGRYGGDKNFPPIISAETRQATAAMRRQKAAAQSPILFIQRKLVCGNCGEKLRRMKQRPPRIRWDCKKCGRRTGTTDSALFQAVTDQLLAVCRSPQAIEKEPTLSPAGSSEFTRLENEINQAMDRRKTDPNELLALIFACAAEKYQACSLGKTDPQTLMLEKLLREHCKDTKLDRDLFEKTVKQVLLQPDASVWLRLQNGVVTGGEPPCCKKQ